MADLLIRMEMPSSCWDCPFCEDYDFLDPYSCDASGRDFEDGLDIYEHIRPDWCPLVELPDHGDLIDRAELLRTTPDVVLDAAWYGYAEGYSEDAIMNVRPIVPASGKEE